MALRIILADDHKMVREGLRCLLETRPDLRVVAEASDGREAVDLAVEHAPHVVILDVSMPVLNGIEAARQIKETRPETAVVALTMHSDNRYVGQMLRAGASGYLLKDCGIDELFEAIDAVVAGRTYLTGSVADVVVSYYVRGEREGSDSAYEALTPRERQVLQLLSEGYAAKQIAHQLNISVKTIDTHRYQLMRKLNLRGVADLTRYALREGISSLTP